MQFSVRLLHDDDVAGVFSSSRFRPLSRLIYCAALFGSEGRLVLNSNPADKLRLVDWPDFDSLPHVPEHRRIAKFMLEKDADLKEIASSLGVGLGLVIGFCNACEAAGLIRRIPVTVREQNQVPAGDDRAVTVLIDRVRGLFKQ